MHSPRSTYYFFTSRICLSFILFALTFISTQAQEQNIQYEYKEGYVYVRFDPKVDSLELDNMLQTINCSISIVDSLNKLSSRKVSESGWELSRYSLDQIAFKKKIGNLEASGKNEHVIIDDNIMIDKSMYHLDVKYGVNKFKKEASVIEKDEDLYTFYLEGHNNAKNVHLSGTFNNWSTMGLPMVKNADRWEISVKLKKGKHLYKFIVDGMWILDPANALKENDAQGNRNSVFFTYNYRFKLENYYDAKKVFLAGSFNGWNPKQLRMNKHQGEWEINMYLEEGLHSYKFVVDDHWILDPANKDVREDGAGNRNSFISFGKSVTFILQGYISSSKVILSGDFNNWNEVELEMKKEFNQWELPIALKPGIYTYKYIVDGKWMNDPLNPHRIGRGDYENCVMSVDPNHTFILEGYSNASTVYLSGTFNNWAEDGYSMKKENGVWKMSVHLPEGKSRYKFIVDGKWILDPKNPLYESNFAGTDDSIIWMK